MNPGSFVGQAPLPSLAPSANPMPAADGQRAVFRHRRFLGFAHRCAEPGEPTLHITNAAPGSTLPSTASFSPVNWDAAPPQHPRQSCNR